MRKRKYDPARVAARIEELRADEEAPLNQTEAAELVGVKQTQWSQWERQVCAPKAETLFRIAQAFGVSVGWILGAED